MLGLMIGLELARSRHPPAHTAACARELRFRYGRDVYENVVCGLELGGIGLDFSCSGYLIVHRRVYLEIRK